MTKADEMTNANSCFNKALLHERLFVLLARDVAAPTAIRAWAQKRVELGKNTWNDAQIQEALTCADAMEKERR